MKTLLTYLRKRDMHALFLAPSDDLCVQLFRYVFVGGIAFVADAGSLMALTWCGLNAYLSTAIAFVIGLITNYALSKRLVFAKNIARQSGVWEFLAYGLIGVIGLGITEGLMWVGLEWWHLPVLPVKILAAAVVLIWNFAARRLALYR